MPDPRSPKQALQIPSALRNRSWIDATCFKVAEQSYLAQLDAVAQGFHESARQMLTPLLLEAEAAGRVQGMRERIAGKVIAQSLAAIAQLENQMKQD